MATPGFVGGLLRGIGGGIDERRRTRVAKEEKDLNRRLSVLRLAASAPNITPEGQASIVRQMLELLQEAEKTGKKPGAGKGGKGGVDLDEAEDFFGGMLGAVGEFEKGTRGEEAGKPVEFGAGQQRTPEAAAAAAAHAPPPGPQAAAAQAVPTVPGVPRREGVEGVPQRKPKMFYTPDDLARIKARQKAIEIETLRQLENETFLDQFNTTIGLYTEALGHPPDQEARHAIWGELAGIPMGATGAVVTGITVSGTSLMERTKTDALGNKIDPTRNYKLTFEGAKANFWPIAPSEEKLSTQEKQIVSMARNLMKSDPEKYPDIEVAEIEARKMVVTETQTGAAIQRERLTSLREAREARARMADGQFLPQDAWRILSAAGREAQWKKENEYYKYRDVPLQTIQDEVLRVVFLTSRVELLRIMRREGTEKPGGKPPGSAKPRAKPKTAEEYKRLKQQERGRGTAIPATIP